MSDFAKAATLSELSNPGFLSVEVNDHFVILIQIDGKVSCIDDVCTHDGGTLSDGELEDRCIVCPRHGARFDAETGKAMCMPATQDTLAHEVRVEGQDILVKLNPAAE